MGHKTLRRSTRIAHEIGKTDAAVAVAQQGEIAQLLYPAIQCSHPLQVAYLVLRQRPRQTAHDGDARLRQRLKDSGQFHARNGDHLVVAAVHQPLRRFTAEESTQQPSVGRNTSVVLLIHKGAGHQHRVLMGAGRDKEAKPLRQGGT